MFVIDFSNNRGPWDELDCRVVDVRSGLTDDPEEFRDKPEVIGDGVEKDIDVDKCLNLTLSLIGGSEQFVNSNTPRSAIS